MQRWSNSGFETKIGPMIENYGFFVTGTDTGTGKTWTTVALMEALKKRGLKVLGMKPVASGCLMEGGNLVNEDAILLRNFASCAPPYQSVNPYAFEPAIAPHIAAEQASKLVRFEKIIAVFKQLQKQSDCVLVEGVGGWEVPLNSNQTVADLAVALQLPVILVVGLRLGCLNHAVLTYNAIVQSGLVCAGWVANPIDPDFAFADENIQTLQKKINAPMLGRLPYLPEFSPGLLSQSIDIERISVPSTKSL